MKTKLLFALLALSMSSCSSFMYSNKAVNNTIRLNSNVPNYSVSFPLLKNQYGNKKDVTGKNWTYTLPELKKKYTTIEVSSENYETQRFVIAKSVRAVPIIMDLTLSLFTFGIPLIIDPFKSDFYKVSEISKNINVEFVYKQSYMWSEYNKIKQSESSYVFEQFLSKYPRFENKAMVINTKDSVEFNTALAQNTEIAITEFIRTHSASLYTAKAVKIEEQFVKNRKDFEETRSINSVESYENFILNHPFAIQLSEAHKLLVDVAEDKATKSNNVISLILYQNNYLNPNKKYHLEFIKIELVAIVILLALVVGLRVDLCKDLGQPRNSEMAVNELRRLKHEEKLGKGHGIGCSLCRQRHIGCGKHFEDVEELVRVVACYSLHTLRAKL